jgi:single-stranded-DNA-specific exonuclease
LFQDKPHSETGERFCLGVRQSVTGRKWTYRHDPKALESYAAATGLPLLQAALLLGRKVEEADVATFLNPTLKHSLPNPSDLRDADKAAGLILDHIAAGSRITLFSDYDVDGGTSAAQLIRWGRGMGYAFGLYVPDRVKEGYGPSTEAFDRLKLDGVDLVVTLDCGAAANEALNHADEIGLPVIVIDHHLMDQTPPPALALVNPNQREDTSGQGHLAAAGVTFMVLVALNREARARGLAPDIDLKSLLGLTALGTICDVVPLRGVNRAIVRQGLKVLSGNRNAGVEALADIASVKPPFTTYHAGFVLGPRINAGGRIGRANMGAELLSTENAQLAYAHAAELDRVNQRRRQMQDRILSEALELAQAQVDDPVLIVAMPNWHPGIIGIVAGRLKDRFGKPAIVIGVDNDSVPPVAKGSGRSVAGVDLGGALAAAKADGLLLSGGGHEMAGGLSISPEHIDAFKSFMRERLKADVEAALATTSMKVDFVLGISAIDKSLLQVIETIGPYGAGNPQPIFAFSGVTVSFAKRTVGDHVRFSLSDSDGSSISGICFGAAESCLDEALLTAGPQRFHAIGRLKENIWNGRTTIDLHLLDIAPELA